MYVKSVLQEHDFELCLLLSHRLLILWFDYGHWPEVYEALVEGIKTIQIDTWLQVQNINHFV